MDLLERLSWFMDHLKIFKPVINGKHLGDQLKAAESEAQQIWHVDSGIFPQIFVAKLPALPCKNMFLRRRWIVTITLGLVTLGLFISPRFATRQFGSFSLALWLYVLGLYVWRNQTHPFAFPVRLVVSATIFCSTVCVTLLPWLFYGGKEGCSQFDPTMTTANGQNFEDLWILMHLALEVYNQHYVVFYLWSFFLSTSKTEASKMG